jgi:hypothetical protein
MSFGNESTTDDVLQGVDLLHRPSVDPGLAAR